MATSTCAKCGNDSFEVKEAKIKGTTFKHYFVQCSSCGAPIGILENDNATENFFAIRKELADLKYQIAQLNSRR